MAGMLPGVEAARRRRIHNTFNSEVSSAASLSRRPSFCLYATTHLFLPKSSTREFPVRQKKELYDESMHLGATVREAKKRLDLRFQSSLTNRMASLLCAIMIATKRRGLFRNTNNLYPANAASSAKKTYIGEEGKEVIVDETAREAKLRLDKKLQGSTCWEKLATSEVPKLKKCGGGKSLRWLKFKWKSTSKCTTC